LGVSRQGEFKNTIETFLQKFHVENFSQKIAQKKQCQFFLDFFVLSRFWVFLRDGSSTKNSTRNPKRFFLDFFHHVFGRFSVREVKKHHDKTISKKNLTLVLFWALTQGKSCHYKLRASPAKATMELPFARNYPAATSELLLSPHRLAAAY
jgi:hypothetical protein